MPMQQIVHLFLFDGFADWESGFAIAGLNSPAFQRCPGRFRVQTAARTLEPVASMGGLHILPDLLLEELTPSSSAMLILPGGSAWDAQENPDAVEVARSFLGAGVPVAAICGATAGLARGGLLDHRRHTSNAREYLAATDYSGRDQYEDAPAVTDGNLITAAGTAPLDFACHIFRRLEVFTPQVLESWFLLFKTGESKHYEALMASLLQA